MFFLFSPLFGTSSGNLATGFSHILEPVTRSGWIRFPPNFSRGKPQEALERAAAERRRARGILARLCGGAGRGDVGGFAVGCRWQAQLSGFLGSKVFWDLFGWFGGVSEFSPIKVSDC